MSKLTKKAKITFGVLTVLAVLATAWGFKDHPVLKDVFSNGGEATTKTASKPSYNNTVPVLRGATVTWPGHSGIYALNGGIVPNDNSELAQRFGITVNMLIDDMNLGRPAFNSDAVDFLWCTVDALPTEMGEGSIFTQENVKFIAAIDKSRGGDVIVGNEFITDATAPSIEGKKIAFAKFSPSNTMLLKFLESRGLSINDIEPVEVQDAVQAAQYFKDGIVDIAAVWSPDDLACLEAVEGSKILVSTKDMPHIIVDGILVKEEVLNARYDDFVALVAAWNHGNNLMNTDSKYKEKTANILARSFEGFSKEEWEDLISNAYYPNIEDNKQFMGISDVEGDGIEAGDLYAEMASIYGQYYGISAVNWRVVGRSSVVRDAEKLLKQKYPHVTYIAEGGQQFETQTVEQLQQTEKSVISSKDVQIQFDLNSFELSTEGKRTVKEQVIPTLETFSNSYIIVTGHTDGVGGNSNANKVLSEKRAEAVRAYIVARYRIHPNRVVFQGLGYSEPKYSGASEHLNRRVEIELVRK